MVKIFVIKTIREKEKKEDRRKKEGERKKEETVTREGEKEDRQKKESEREKEETVQEKEREFGKKEGNTYRYCTNLYICKILNNYRVLTSRKYRESTEGIRPYVPALE